MPQVWDEQGNPVTTPAPSSKGQQRWDENGNPVDEGLLSKIGTGLSVAGTGAMDFGKGAVETVAGMGNMILHPIQTLLNENKRVKSEASQAYQSAKGGQYIDALGHALAINP